MHVGKGLDVVLKVFAHHALHGIAIEADHVRQQIAGEHRRAAGLFFENDLKENAPSEVFTGLRIDHLEIFVPEHQLLHVGQRDVRTGASVIQPAIRVFLDQAQLISHLLILLGGGESALVLQHYIATRKGKPRQGAGLRQHFLALHKKIRPCAGRR